MGEKVLLAIGTRKGLWLATRTAGAGSTGGWEATGPHQAMSGIAAIAIDTRGPVPRLLIDATHEHFGPCVLASDDLGATWSDPDQPPIAFPSDTETTLARVWQLTPGPPTQPEVVYAGVEPSALFRSVDRGQSYELIRGLWDHPHREKWAPGFGGQAIHTILPHPTAPEKITVAMSTGGVYQTADNGNSWQPSNKGVSAYFLPDNYPEFGQCVHKVAQHPSRPDRMFLQNHPGVYRSDDAGASWRSIADGLPSDFGFAMLVHPHEPEVIYNFPLTADALRFAPDGHCRVYRSVDAGGTWAALGNGLPDDFWSIVLRDALCADGSDPAGIYFGTRSGEVYASRDEGDHWQQVVAHLPDVLCVRAAVV
jgi:hypothetical protein